MLSFTYPYAFVIGLFDWAGVQIWDMARCEPVRHLYLDGAHFHNIHLYGRFITICEVNMTRRGKDIQLSLKVFDTLDLVNSKIESKDLWSKCYSYSPGHYFEKIDAVSNQTSLIVYHASTISILNFWKDRLIPSREFEPQNIETEDEMEKARKPTTCCNVF